MTIIESHRNISKKNSLDSIDQLASTIDNRFGIPRTVVLESIEGLQMLKDGWE